MKISYFQNFTRYNYTFKLSEQFELNCSFGYNLFINIKLFLTKLNMNLKEN